MPEAARGKARHRQGLGRSYTPQKTVDAERSIAWEAKKCLAGRPPLEGPVMLKITARYAYPASWSTKRRATTVWKTSKPDFDNIEKLISDALKGICWKDDAQVALNQTTKCYVSEYEPREGMTIEIGTLEHEN